MIQNNPSVFQQPNLNYCFFCCKIVFLSSIFLYSFYFLYSFFLLSRNLSIFLMTLLSCLQLPKMQCNKNVCLHMDMYYLQDYIIAKMFLLVTRSWYIAALCNFSILFPLYRKCLKGSNKVAVFIYFFQVSIICPISDILNCNFYPFQTRMFC